MIEISNETKQFIKEKLKPLLKRNDVEGTVRECNKQPTNIKNEAIAFMLDAGIPLINKLDDIPNNMFENSPLASIKISSNIYAIGNNAFKDSNVQYVDFEEGVEDIGKDAFRNTKVSVVTLPESIKKIGSFAFAETPLKEIYIPESITALPKGVFEGCRPDLVVYTPSRKNLPPSKRLHCPNSELEWYKQHLKMVSQNGGEND